MGGIAIDLLPGDAELARRAAGGDGAAFVRLYDHYSADVFEASLAATGSVEKAADATQIAFLKLLKRPPAIDAPDSEVAERLRAIALGAGVEAAPMSRRTAEGNHMPSGAGVGWLRSETVAKASARFDQDWSAYLDNETGGTRTLPEVPRTPSPPPVERVESERPLVVPAPLPPLATIEGDDPPRRRMRPLALPRVPLPSAAALAALLLIALFGTAMAVVLTSGGGEATKRTASVDPDADADKAADRPAARGDVAGVKRSSRAKRGSRRTARSAGGLGTGAAEGRRGLDVASYDGSGGAPIGGSRGVTRTVSAPAPTGGGTTGGGGTGGSGGGGTGDVSPDTTRSPQAITVSPPSDPPPPEPAPTSEPAPEPAPTETGSGGANRNCNSKNSSSPC